MKKNIKKISAIILGMSLLLGMMGEIKAEGIMNSEEVVVDNYLQALRDGNVMYAYSMMVDERVEINEEVEKDNISPKEREYVSYIQSGDYFGELYWNNPISDYEVIGIKGNKVIANLIFSDGTTNEVPFCVENGKVIISLEDIDGESENLNATTDLEAINGVADIAPQYNPIETLVDTYSFSYLMTTIYGNNTFNLSSDNVKIYLYQNKDAASSSSAELPRVQYSIVSHYWYGDDVWADYNGVNGAGNFTIILKGKSSSASNVVIRITSLSGAYPRTAGHGRVYQVL